MAPGMELVMFNECGARNAPGKSDFPCYFLSRWAEEGTNAINGANKRSPLEASMYVAPGRRYAPTGGSGKSSQQIPVRGSTQKHNDCDKMSVP